MPLPPTVALGADLRALVACRPWPLESVYELTRLRSPSQARASFRLEFAGGRLLKGRSFKTPARCRTAFELGALIAHLPFNRMLAREGNSALEEWIEGEALTAESVGGEHAAWAGELLGRLHATAIPAVNHRDGAWYRRFIETNLHALHDAGELSGAAFDVLRECAAHWQPDRVESALIHTDLAPENLVHTVSGDLVVIDNEHLQIGAPGYDLARCRYRWPMNTAQRSAFDTVYGRYRDPAGDGDARFWHLAALAQSARVRSAYGYCARAPLEQMRQLINDL